MRRLSAEFERFLLERLNLNVDEAPQQNCWTGTGNTIGAIALRLDLLNLDQINDILDVQENEHALFGQIAIGLGYTTEQQVDRLIALQCFHQLIDIGEMLVLADLLSIERLQELALEFYRTNQIEKRVHEIVLPA